MLTATQKKTAEAIVNIFETGSVRGNYGEVTLIEGDTGHLTFGRSQTTLGSGNLHKLLDDYCSNPGARFGKLLSPFVPRCAAPKPDFSLDHDKYLHNILRASADDPVMRETQDVFFDKTYWQPAQRTAEQLGILSPLGIAVVYDSRVHGSWKLMFDRTNQQVGTLAKLGERAWIEAYVDTRRHWLATHSRRDLRATAYRMDAFKRLIELDLWGLELPLVVRGLEISEATLNATPPGCYDGPQPGSRALTVQSPLLRGLDVRLLQLGLSREGIDVRADGVFGRGTAEALKLYQRQCGLPLSGVADTELIARLLA
jgi:Putative peptidoglycan-binding domain-containing protein